jgi:hypothetical protein
MSQLTSNIDIATKCLEVDKETLDKVLKNRVTNWESFFEKVCKNVLDLLSYFCNYVLFLVYNY